jgi:NAD(P)-dependent dehydrogenase (short-subunit alcohol dehydrogenase family)
MELKNKIVVITGGSKGVGKALAISFIKEGAKVIISSHQKNDLKKTAEEIGATAIEADVTKEQELIDLAEKVIKNFGELNIWVNNAGILYRFPKEELIDIKKAHEIFDVNFFGTVFGCRTALKYMNNKDNPLILNIVSKNAIDATREINNKLYAASKWAVRGFMQAFQSENNDSNIKFINVYPGGVQTDLWKGLDVKDFANFMTSEHVAEVVIENLKKENPEEEQIIKRPNSNPIR